MPGRLRGIDKNGDKVTLGSYAMIYLETTGANREPASLVLYKTPTVKRRYSLFINKTYTLYSSN